MERASNAVRRCAVYTRKSSEEGLEQDFNSLHAQREASEAFIKSQQGEGWKLIKTAYDDGGLSGGNMERPALQRLLQDIRHGLIDVVVVYKVDRLTRSLADFAKMVEVFDAQGVSFVAVTQQFNTTTSMGRLTLNVLLSFAQFEREVTGERIRDKIAASKRKGIWMGGCPPIGYDVCDRRLVINQADAETVRQIYQRYLKTGSVPKLKKALDRDGVVSKIRVSRKGNRSGGQSFSRGALYELLSNPIYVGEIRHKRERHPGQHDALLDRNLWEKVQKRLHDHTDRPTEPRTKGSPNPLAGKVFDETGEPLYVQAAVKDRRRYRYYVSKALVRVIERSAQPYLAIKEHLAMRDIARIASEVLPELFGWLERNGVAPSGAPFFKYNVIEMTGQLEIEVGIPTLTVISADGRVLTGVLPAGRYAVVTFRGSYDRLVDANAALLGWLSENGLRPEMKATSAGDQFGCRLEIYHTDPTKEPNPEKRETEIAVQLAI